MAFYVHVKLGLLCALSNYVHLNKIMLQMYVVETSSRPHSPPTDDAVTNPTYNTVTITDDHSKQQGKEPIRCYAEVIIPTQLN